jgi:elongation factor G
VDTFPHHCAAHWLPLVCLVLQGIRVVLNDGAAHAVDSNEMAFRLAAIGGFRQAYASANPAILEPIMKVCFVSMDMHQSGVTS